jgi:uncharacterized protein YbaR (Trm112 family)
MKPELLDILCCPITHRPLKKLDASGLQRLNTAIAEGRIKTHQDELLVESLQEALVTDDDRLVYPVRGGIPVLLEEECIDTIKLGD